MCGVFATFNCYKLTDLYYANKDRGDGKFSLCSVKSIKERISFGSRLSVPKVWKESKLGLAKSPQLERIDDYYDHWYKERNNLLIGHCLLSTGYDKDSENDHPSERLIENIGNGARLSYLWHNGIIKRSWINEMTEQFIINGGYEYWDTHTLNFALTKEIALNDKVGQFACIWARTDYRYFLSEDRDIQNNSVIVFRNDLAPLFMEKDDKDRVIAISSDAKGLNEKKRERVPAGIFFAWNLSTKKFTEVKKFSSDLVYMK